jgi:cell division protein FtsB
MLVANLIRFSIHLRERGDIIKEAKDKLIQVKEEQAALERKLAQSENPDYIIKQARDKLNFIKEGETIVILPSISPIKEMTPIPTPDLSNLQKWVKLFF